MNKVIKLTALVALLSPSLSFATAIDGPDDAITGEVEIAGDGSSGGGTGWLNTGNDTFNEINVEFETSGEVFVGADSNKAIAYARAVHLGGKGTVFTNTTYGWSGICAEDTAAQQTVAEGNPPVAAALAGLDSATTTFNNDSVTPIDVDASTLDRDYALSDCTAPGTAAAAPSGG